MLLHHVVHVGRRPRNHRRRADVARERVGLFIAPREREAVVEICASAVEGTIRAMKSNEQENEQTTKQQTQVRAAAITLLA